MIDRLRPFLFPALALALAFAAWRSYGWQGLILAVLMMVFWVLLHLTKLMRLLQAAAERPVGKVRDAWGLNKRLRRGKSLADVMRLTHSLGERHTEAGQDPEIMSWTDERGHRVRCTFVKGRLQSFELQLAGTEATEEGSTHGDDPTPRT
jgi:hypothetical protein